jgi:hypothetical protein
MKRALQTFFGGLLMLGFWSVCFAVWANVFGIGAAL